MTRAHESKGRSRRRGYLIAVLAVVLTAGVVALVVGLGRSTPQPAEPAKPAATAPVTRQNLTTTIKATGELGHGTERKVGAKVGGGAEGSGPGTVTWLPPAGTIVDRGQQLFRIDDKPTVLLLGVLPAYRDLGVGDKGPDVQQLEENLAALGYGGFTVDETYSATTAKAVKAWQKGLGLKQTGSVPADQVVYQPEAIRVSGQAVQIGAPAAAELLTVTGTERVVQAKLSVSEARAAEVGGAVTVVLPDGTRVPGTITEIGQPVTEEETAPGQGTKQATVTITVKVDDTALGTLDKTNVDVELTSDARTDVLTVPVSALLALAEGGYAVEVVNPDGTTRLIPVTTGLFASGRVEVTGDLADGDLVVVPR